MRDSRDAQSAKRRQRRDLRHSCITRTRLYLWFPQGARAADLLGQNRFRFASSDEAPRWLTLKLGRKDEAVVRDIMVSVSYELRVDVSLNSTNEVTVRVDGGHSRWNHVRAIDWRRSLETGASKWAEEINKGRLYARKPSDKIPDFCLYLSLYIANKKPGECGLSCVDEDIRLW